MPLMALRYSPITKPANTTVSGCMARRADSHSTPIKASAAPSKATQPVPYSNQAGANTVHKTKAVCAPLLTAKVLSAAKGLRITCCSSMVAKDKQPPANKAMSIRGKVVVCTSKASKGKASGCWNKSAQGHCHCRCSNHALLAVAPSSRISNNRPTMPAPVGVADGWPAYGQSAP